MKTPCSLAFLLDGLVATPPDIAIMGVSSDSRQVVPGGLFLAVRGAAGHGLDYLPQVLAMQPAAVAWEPPYLQPPEGAELPLLAVEKLRTELPLIGERFYGTPAKDLQLVGITGTDGKTSCAHFLSQALDEPHQRCGYMGTLGYGFPGDLHHPGLTTPDPLAIQAALANLRDRQARVVAMEVSSHALDQQRVAGLPFAVAVLTNLGRDHLDYHGSLEAYRAAKTRLFTDHQPACAVLNTDDGLGRELLQQLPSAVGYGFGPPQGARWVHGQLRSLGQEGLHLQVRSHWGEGEFHSPLLGAFNGLNLLAVCATLLVLGVPFAEALARLERITTVPGRMERLQTPGQPLAVIDYAHTPGALHQALLALREHTPGKLWCVFGCGGERDTGKRAAMGAIAETHADRVIVTNDNPRGESPEVIAGAILAGCREPQKIILQLDRAAAIATALAEAAADDVVLIAGKGHEDYQLLGGLRLEFSDRDTVRRLWQENGRG